MRSPADIKEVNRQLQLINFKLPVFEQPIIFSIRGAISNDDHSMAQSVAIAIGDIQDPIGIKLHDQVA